jgi:hypothetical protein
MPDDFDTWLRRELPAVLPPPDTAVPPPRYRQQALRRPRTSSWFRANRPAVRAGFLGVLCAAGLATATAAAAVHAVDPSLPGFFGHAASSCNAHRSCGTAGGPRQPSVSRVATNMTGATPGGGRDTTAHGRLGTYVRVPMAAGSPGLSRSHGGPSSTPGPGRSHGGSSSSPGLGRGRGVAGSTPEASRGRGKAGSSPGLGRSHAVSSSTPGASRGRAKAGSSAGLGRSHAVSGSTPGSGRGAVSSGSSPSLGHGGTHSTLVAGSGGGRAGSSHSRSGR